MLIDIKNLTFAYEGQTEPVFENLTIQLNTDWKLGCIGRNGYGKTTFLHLLQNKLEYTGSIIAPVQFEYFPYSFTNTEEFCYKILQERFPDIEIKELEKELSLLDTESAVLYRSFSTLSAGERTKLLLAAMFVYENRFLLIDEPTNHLDMYGRKAVAEYLRRKSGFILVSHDRDFLNRTVNHILAIEKNNITVQIGNYDTWEENKIRRDNYEIEKNIRLRKEIKRLKEAARQRKGWADLKEKTKKGAEDKGFVSHRAAKLMNRAKNIEHNAEKAVTEKAKLLKNIERLEDIPMKPLIHHAKKLITAERLSVLYDGKKVFVPVDFTLCGGECLCINGKNGAGKSSILKLLTGEALEFIGSFNKASGLKISYLPQNFQFLSGSLFAFIEKYNIDTTVFLTTLHKLNFPPELFECNMQTYSSGQKKKVLLAKSICEKAHVYIWDEPLNYIDIISRIQIETMILKYKPALILVEHDIRFTEAVATDLLHLK
ncbi:ribosomal protection-like ABC-F family protein [Treponema pedis]|nr:ABC-F type ribosomal protection protein [Treponema pedis]